ncbi:hypothetical protein [Streptomyces sp. YGL11-2]|uniref:hypothetical protein n=1 Tax=Streptomyces sp. YGL11-2 TaxID=3414028 RepID=UPI003CEAFA30
MITENSESVIYRREAITWYAPPFFMDDDNPVRVAGTPEEIHPLPGDRLGHLVLLELGERGRCRALCDCGTKRSFWLRHLMSGNTQSCGKCWTDCTGDLGSCGCWSCSAHRWYLDHGWTIPERIQAAQGAWRYGLQRPHPAHRERVNWICWAIFNGRMFPPDLPGAPARYGVSRWDGVRSLRGVLVR